MAEDRPAAAIISNTTYQVAPPEPFTFSRKASGLAGKGEEVQGNTLIYSIGDEADDILREFRLTEDDKSRYDVVKARFESHFI